MSVWFDVPELSFYFACFSLIFGWVFVVNCSDLNSVGCGFLFSFLMQSTDGWQMRKTLRLTLFIYIISSNNASLNLLGSNMSLYLFPFMLILL